MKTSIFGFIGFALAMTLLVGCDSTPEMPEVNYENCNKDYIHSLDLPKKNRQEFIAKCSTSKRIEVMFGSEALEAWRRGGDEGLEAWKRDRDDLRRAEEEEKWEKINAENELERIELKKIMERNDREREERQKIMDTPGEIAP